MSKEYKRDKNNSMVELAVKISTAPENCEGDNWGDAINLFGEADILIKQYEARIEELESQLKLSVPIDTHRQTVEDFAERGIEIAALQAQLSEKGEYGYSQQVVDALTKERDALQAQLLEEQWRSVEDELPEKSQYVLIFCDGLNDYVADGFYKQGLDWRGVTHWRPISLPSPSGKKGDGASSAHITDVSKMVDGAETGLYQCPFDKACKCHMKDPCEGCETFAEHHKCQPDAELVDALEYIDGQLYTLVHTDGAIKRCRSHLMKAVTKTKQALTLHRSKQCLAIKN